MRRSSAWLASVFIALALLLSLTRGADQAGQALTREALTKAAVTFASARLINGAISVLKGTEVGVAVGGTLTFSVGEILDPLHDLIEQLSTVLLVALTSLGIQVVLLELMSLPWLSGLLLLLGGLSLAALFWVPLRGLFNPFMRGFMLLLALRFALLAVVMANQWVYQAVLSERYELANRELAEAGAALEQARLNESAAAAEVAESDGISSWWSDVRSSVDPAQRLAAMRLAAEQTLQQALDLITVFVLQTLLLPLLFVAFIFYFGRLLVRLDYEKIAAPKIR